MKISIKSEKDQTFKNGSLWASGAIELSNGISVYFSDIHEIKTMEEARKIADILVYALNSVK